VREGRISQLSLYALCFSISEWRYSEAMVFAYHGARRAEEAISEKLGVRAGCARYVAIDVLFKYCGIAGVVMFTNLLTTDRCRSTSNRRVELKSQRPGCAVIPSTPPNTYQIPRRTSLTIPIPIHFLPVLPYTACSPAAASSHPSAPTHTIRSSTPCTGSADMCTACRRCGRRPVPYS
jgi:hypothetical protein